LRINYSIAGPEKFEPFFILIFGCTGCGKTRAPHCGAHNLPAECL
jgi:tRNA A37 N6-isopentenylltransferase MiaA